MFDSLRRAWASWRSRLEPAARDQKRLERERAWENRREWEFVGSESYGKTSGQILPWVERFIEKQHGGSSLGELHFILKGRSFWYRVSFAGQGGPTAIVERSSRKERSHRSHQ